MDFNADDHYVSPDLLSLETYLTSQIYPLPMIFGLTDEADAVEKAVESVLVVGYRSPDLTKPGEKMVDMQAMGEMVVEAL